MIERGEFDALRKHHRFGGLIAERIYNPGDVVPDYMLRPPEGLIIMRESIMVTKDTL
jgi:hypothetical protein